MSTLHPEPASVFELHSCVFGPKRSTLSNVLKGAVKLLHSLPPGKDNRLQYHFSFETSSLQKILQCHPEYSMTNLTEIYLDTEEFQLAKRNMWLKYVRGPVPRWSLKVVKRFVPESAAATSTDSEAVAILEYKEYNDYDVILKMVQEATGSKEESINDICFFRYADIDTQRVTFAGTGYEISLDLAEFPDARTYSVGCIRMNSKGTQVCKLIPEYIQSSLMIEQPTNSKIIHYVSKHYECLLEDLRSKGILHTDSNYKESSATATSA